MPNTVAKIVRNDAAGIVATDGVRRENAQRRTSSGRLRSLESSGMTPIGRARKNNARNIPREVIEGLNVAMTAGPARAGRNDTKIIITNPTIRPSQTNRSLRSG